MAQLDQTGAVVIHWSDEPKPAVGTVVKLRSGGPLMTVEEMQGGSPELVQCTWFRDAQVCREAFTANMLEWKLPNG